MEKDTFDEIEFFIPQIAHMIIHFGGVNRKLWNLMIMICQVSMHSALLLSFIFYAAMEDYQPEDANGVDNIHKDAKLHTHCSHLLTSIEKVVLLGSPALMKLELSASDKEKSLLEFEELEAESRIRDSELIIEMENEGKDVHVMSGELLYKRVEKKSMFVRKVWKPRYFKIENKVLNCYHDAKYEELLRSIPLQDCQVLEVHNPHHVNCFEVHSPITFTVFKLRAQSRDEMLKWIEGISGYVLITIIFFSFSAAVISTLLVQLPLPLHCLLSPCCIVLLMLCLKYKKSRRPRGRVSNMATLSTTSARTRRTGMKHTPVEMVYCA